jgi:antitoxin component YwqK of YwqJK toxin-antitoxin module
MKPSLIHALALLIVAAGCRSARSSSMDAEPGELSKEQRAVYYSVRSRVLGSSKRHVESSLAILKSSKEKAPRVVTVLLRWERFNEWGRINDGFTDTESEDAIISVLDASDKQSKHVIAVHQLEWSTHRKFFRSLTNQLLLVTLYVTSEHEACTGRLLDLIQVDGGLKNGQRNGPWLTRNLFGSKLEEGRYKAGQQEGIWTFYWSHGQKRKRGAFAKGQLNGPWSFWYSSGKLAKKGQYKNGQKHSSWTSYFESGQREQSLQYQSGILSGAASRYWSNGKKRETGRYEKSQMTGSWVFWHSNGQKQQHGVYLAGEKNGCWKTWSKTGELIEESHWSEGQLTR